MFASILFTSPIPKAAASKIHKLSLQICISLFPTAQYAFPGIYCISLSVIFFTHFFEADATKAPTVVVGKFTYITRKEAARTELKGFVPFRHCK